MDNWSTESNWYGVSVLLAAVTLWLWRDLRDSNQRKRHLAEIAQTLSDKCAHLEKVARSLLEHKEYKP